MAENGVGSAVAFELGDFDAALSGGTVELHGGGQANDHLLRVERALSSLHLNIAVKGNAVLVQVHSLLPTDRHGLRRGESFSHSDRGRGAFRFRPGLSPMLGWCRDGLVGFVYESPSRRP